jgi:sulfofructose kinase
MWRSFLSGKPSGNMDDRHNSTMKLYDVFGIGAITIDLIGKSATWPGAGEKVRLEFFDVFDGGLTATALVTVARLGGKAAIGAKLGHSIWASRAVEALEKEGVDTTNILRINGCEPVISIVIANQDNYERNIFFSRNGVSYPFPEELPDQDWFKRTSVLLIDHGTGKAGVEAAKLAVQHGMEVVIDAERVEPYLEEMFGLCTHIVVSRKFALMYSGMDDVRKAAFYLRQFPSQHIIITLGEMGILGLSGDQEFSIPGHIVPVADTTGCGDVFHGAYALAIARGNSCRDAAAYANAVAALSATRVGGRDGIPDPAQLTHFKRDNPF